MKTLVSVPKTAYFIGIGGIGMSACAGIAAAVGVVVGGSDSKDVYDPAKRVLDSHKIPYTVGYAREHFEKFVEQFGVPDVAVVTAALDGSNPEVAYAKERGIATVSFAEFLGELLGTYQRVVVVGTHGKGTTSGLISYVLKNLCDDSFFVGGVLTNLATNFYVGKGKRFVLEGDEYVSSAFDPTPKFMYYAPDVLLINNVEFDHPDVYKSLGAVKGAFAGLVAAVPEAGTVVYNADDANVRDVVKGFAGKKISFGFGEGANLRGGEISVERGTFKFSASGAAGDFEIDTSLPGKIYAYDNLAAAAVLTALGIAPDDFLPHFARYTGIERRYQVVADGTIAIIDDYAHHATAVAATLDATKLKYPGRRIVCVFEPHTYSRTRETVAELANAFTSADVAFIAEVYPAREQKLESSITGHDVVAKVLAAHPGSDVRYVADRADALGQLKAELRRDDVVIVMAVGSFNTLVNDLKDLIK